MKNNDPLGWPVGLLALMWFGWLWPVALVLGALLLLGCIANFISPRK